MTLPRTPSICPRGCGREGQIGPIALHAKTCPYPFTLERFREIREIVVDQDCWLWLPLDTPNYPTAGGKRIHCMIAEWKSGAPAAVACHTCDRHRCVNPDHIYAGDYFSNIADSIRNGTHRGITAERARASALERWARRDGSIGRKNQ